MRAVLSAVVIAVATLWPAAAEADLVRLANGATLSVKSATLDGDTMVLTLRAGGEVRTPRALVAEVRPDEVLHADADSIVTLPDVAPKPAPAVPGDLPALVDQLAAEFGVPAKLAHALIANNLLTQLNTTYKKNFALVDVNAIADADLTGRLRPALRKGTPVDEQ